MLRSRTLQDFVLMFFGLPLYGGVVAMLFVVHFQTEGVVSWLAAGAGYSLGVVGVGAALFAVWEDLCHGD
jgi:hypothetical protein